MKTINELGISNFEFASTIITQLSNKAKIGVVVCKNTINKCIEDNLSELEELSGYELDNHSKEICDVYFVVKNHIEILHNVKIN